MTREQALNYMRSSGWSEEQINTVTDALTCDDAISRRAVLDILDDAVKDYTNENDFDKALGIAWVKVQRLPFVTTQQKGGSMRLINYDDLDATIQRLNEEGWNITRNDYKLIDNVLFEMAYVTPAPKMEGVEE